MNEVKQIVEEIKSGNQKPIYLLTGEEPYYIDKISQFIEENILNESEKAFNQVVLYGANTTVDEIITNAKRFPMMADKQVVIVKEAQELSRNIENLTNYAQNPQPSTILVINYKYKKIDKRKSLYKSIKKVGVVMESKKLYENQVLDWIRRVLAAKGLHITPRASQMLVAFLGTDLNKINNELEKLQIVLKDKQQIDSEIIESNIGISKDYNNFELRRAIGLKDKVKVYKIVHYFANNPRDNPIVLTIAGLNTFFTQLLQYHGLSDKSRKAVASNLGINPFFVEEYVKAAKLFPMKTVSRAISLLREYDLMSKGVGANNVSQGDLLKELLVKIMN